MSGIRETRKKLQRSVIYIAQCSDSHAALRELYALRLTVESQIELLEKPAKEESHATNTERDIKETEVAQAASQGFNTIYEADGCARRECV
jgi:viroplasmin and RNaseH domain-containing protein